MLSAPTLALIIFLITYTGIIFTRLPGINIDRPSAAFFGSVALILTGVVSLPEAAAAIDYNTIALLLGMMIIIATLQLDGFISLIAAKTIAWSGNQRRLLSVIVFATGISSAFLVNDAVVLLFTPVIITICRSSGLTPVPYLIATILASNAGSVMTMTGNPQNMLVGINSGIDYSVFLLRLLPVAVLGLIVVILTMRVIYPSQFRERKPISYRGEPFEYQYQSMRWSVPIFLLVILAFFFSPALHLSLPVIALAGASLILIFGKVRPSRVIGKVDWVLLLFFASLFIVVHAVEKEGLLDRFLGQDILRQDSAGLLMIHGLSLALSQLVSNVPFTIVMLPMMKAAGSDLLWLALASASTLAGNATVIGAMANLIVLETAQQQGVRISFREFLLPGLAVTLVSLVLSFAILWLQMMLL